MSISLTLLLRHASKLSSGTWGPDDWDVIDANRRDIGRIFKPRAGAPPDHPWEWAITGAVVMPHLPSHGFCASLEEANAKFADDMARLPAVTGGKPCLVSGTGAGAGGWCCTCASTDHVAAPPRSAMNSRRFIRS